jgi:hypothetical protein
MTFFRAGLIVALFLCICAPKPVCAQQDKLALARVHYERGKEFFKQRKYDEALVELEKAYSLDPRPELIYNLARVHEERGDLDNAIRYYKSYLVNQPRAPNAKEVRRTIRRLKSLRNRGRILVTTKPPGAIVKIDGRRAGISPTKSIVVSSGVRQVQISLAGFSTHTENVLVTQGQPSRLSVTLKPTSDHVVIETTPPGAMATIFLPSPRNLGTCPCSLRLSPGRYRMRVSMPGYVTANFEIVKSKGQPLRQQVPLVRASNFQNPTVTDPLTNTNIRRDPGPDYTETVGPTIQSEATGWRTSWGWAIAGTGMASILGGGAFTTLALVNKFEFDNGTYYRPTEQPEMLLRHDITQLEAFNLESQAVLFMNISYGLYAAGGAALATGLFLILTDDGADESPHEYSMRSLPLFTVTPVPGGAMFGFTTTFN